MECMYINLSSIGLSPYPYSTPERHILGYFVQFLLLHMHDQKGSEYTQPLILLHDL